ncbi:hypothetical protein AVEN_87954-1 [Araneus ventricosus]|uniref:Uncharacterized protein n=1 Tax=Araneus ventricosus TaxID=182803 RepID=A0A4Y2NH73_ARAVE|nr:hypothetical protein AVEN_87954-1 [Araneus ventricosus]
MLKKTVNTDYITRTTLSKLQSNTSGRTLNSRYQTSIHSGSSIESDFEPGTLHSVSRGLITKSQAGLDFQWNWIWPSIESYFEPGALHSVNRGLITRSPVDSDFLWNWVWRPRSPDTEIDHFNDKPERMTQSFDLWQIKHIRWQSISQNQGPQSTMCQHEVWTGENYKNPPGLKYSWLSRVT